MKSENLSEQYQTDENLRIRIETHQRYTVGPPLEPAIDAALALQPDEALLDIGTGAGGFPQRLRQAGHRGRLVGVDASAGMIAKAKSAGADVEFLYADAASLPCPDHSFDVVTARHMLYHVPDIPTALREARRVLRPGGRFLAVTNIHDSMGEYRRAIDEAANRLKGEIADVMRLSIATADAFSERNGPGLIEQAFGNVAMTFVEAALRFETAEPALRYFDSCRTLKGFSVEEWAVARAEFAKVVAERLGAEPWLVTKTVVLFRAFKFSSGERTS